MKESFRKRADQVGRQVVPPLTSYLSVARGADGRYVKPFTHEPFTEEEYANVLRHKKAGRLVVWQSADGPPGGEV